MATFTPSPWRHRRRKRGSSFEVVPAGVVRTGDETILVRISDAFGPEQDILNLSFVANGRTIRLGDIANVSRGPADQAQQIFRVNGREAIGLAIAMRMGGDVLALGRNTEHAVADFMAALWEAIAIVLGVSLVSLGLRAGAVVAFSIPLVLAAVFVTMAFTGIDLQRISLGALIIAPGSLVDDAMITVESIVTRPEQCDDKGRGATFAYRRQSAIRIVVWVLTASDPLE